MLPRDMISAVRTQLVLRHSFFGTLALHMPVVESASIPTAATDGRSLFYNSSFVERVVKTHRLAGLQTVVAHEVLHAALHHCFRLGGRIPFLWNMATDLAVNLLLKESGFNILPGMLYDDTFAGMSAEAIYDLLQRNSSLTSMLTQTYGAGQPGDHSMWNASGHDTDNIKTQWKAALSRAVQASQMSADRGKLPAGLAKIVEDVLYPRLNWREVLVSFLQPVKADYSFLPPDRRFDDIVLPDFNTDAVEEIVVAIDTSGSTYEYIPVFLGELRGILASFPQISGYIVQCDAAVQDWRPLSEYELKQAEIKGFGGTDFRPVFQQVEERGIDPTALIYLTDGYGRYPDHQPYYPVLWALTCEPQEAYYPPFGQVIRLNFDSSAEKSPS